MIDDDALGAAAYNLVLFSYWYLSFLFLAASQTRRSEFLILMKLMTLKSCVLYIVRMKHTYRR